MKKKLVLTKDVSASIDKENKKVSFEYNTHVYTFSYVTLKSFIKKAFVLQKIAGETPLEKTDFNKIEAGAPFVAIIEGIPCTGKIQIEEGEVYLCQDVKNGNKCYDKLGFKYSWTIRDGKTPEAYHVRIISFTKYPKRKVPKIDTHFCDYSVHILLDEIKVGCQKIPNEMVEKLMKEIS